MRGSGSAPLSSALFYGAGFKPATVSPIPMIEVDSWLSGPLGLEANMGGVDRVTENNPGPAMVSPIAPKGPDGVGLSCENGNVRHDAVVPWLGAPARKAPTVEFTVAKSRVAMTCSFALCRR